MACASCEKRRKIIQNAYQKGGMRGLVKAMPKMARTVWRKKEHLG